MTGGAGDPLRACGGERLSVHLLGLSVSSWVVIIIISVALLEELNEIGRHRVPVDARQGLYPLILLSGHPARRRGGD